MDLDTRMKIDLGELLYTGQITNALAVEKEFGVASRAIPGYYAGDRSAKTVIVMLNQMQNELNELAQNELNSENVD